MKPIKISLIREWLNSVNTINNDIEITKVTKDITKINDNTLVFHLNKDVELNWEQYNSLSNCVIVTDQAQLLGSNLNNFLFVLDVDKSYQDFILRYRNLFNIPVVAITGTCGKTTTKEIIKQILQKKYNVTSTESNKNALGYDHDYLLSIDDSTNFAVFETAISYPGNLIYGCNYFKPEIGIITNIGIDHLSGCKNLDNYIRTKGEILAGLQYKGTLIINNDDENIKKLNLKFYQGKIITFGLTKDATLYASRIEYKEQGMAFILHYDNKEYSVYVPGLGVHNVYNSLAALAALIELKQDIYECIHYLKTVKFIRSHLEFHQGINNSIIIDDTWSSNPTSMKAAFEVLKEKGIGKTKFAVLGKISYLGDYAETHYENIGKWIVEYGIDFLITTDSFSKQIAKYALKYGFNTDFHLHCINNKHLKTNLEALLDKNAIVLFKISMLDQSIREILKAMIVE